jgi:hypothetical protein
LSPEEQKYYETYLDLFIHDGWKQFEDELEEILDSYRIEDIKDERNLAYVKGERNAFFRMRRFANGIKYAYERMQEQDDA